MCEFTKGDILWRNSKYGIQYAIVLETGGQLATLDKYGPIWLCKAIDFSEYCQKL